MFEKISGFFKQFTRRRKRQSGETTIMESKEPSADDFGLDDEFADVDTFGDEAGPGDSGGGSGGFDETDIMGDTGEPIGAVSAELETEPGAGGAFSDFDLDTDEPGISTGGEDFDARTVSDEISGPETGVDEIGGDFADAFAVGEDAQAMEAAVEAKPPSAVKTILTLVIVAVVAVGVGVAFQMFAWPKVSGMVGLGGGDEVALDPQAEFNNAQREKARLTKELAEFKTVGGPADIKALKQEIAETRDAQGSIEEFEAKFQDLQTREKAYDKLVNRIGKLESAITETNAGIGRIRTEIEQTTVRVIELAKQTEEEYKRFKFELVRAELSQRLLIELRLEDITSFRAEVAKLQERLAKLSVTALASASGETAPSAEAPAAGTSEN